MFTLLLAANARSTKEVSHASNNFIFSYFWLHDEINNLIKEKLKQMLTIRLSNIFFCLLRWRKIGIFWLKAKNYRVCCLLKVNESIIPTKCSNFTINLVADIYSINLFTLKQLISTEFDSSFGLLSPPPLNYSDYI